MKLSLCNEVLAHLSFAEQCRFIKDIGCDGIEIAPFTLIGDPATLTEKDAKEHLKIARDHGLEISSLHWLMVKPDGLSISTPDRQVWQKSVAFLEHMIDFAAACEAPILVHGSPKQRSPIAGQSTEDALQRATEAWAKLARKASAASLTYCIEPLSRLETSVINTLSEAAAIVDQIKSPALRTMLDLSSCANTEIQSPQVLARQYLASKHIAHVQVNDKNRQGPFQGDTPVRPLLQSLIDANYTGWIAIEPFVYSPTPEGCAAFCASHCRSTITELQNQTTKSP